MFLNKLHIKFIILCLVIVGGATAQERKVGNLPKYYSRVLHFGFSLGINQTDFVITSIPNFYTRDSLKSVQSEPEMGFNLGIISDFRLAEYISVRFVPDLAFAQRNLNFYFEGKRDTIMRVKKVESTFLNFPVDFKFRSARMNNFGAYLLAGFKYTFDLASQKDVKNTSPEEAVIKLSKHDFSYQLGAGVEFYFPYFKFAFEGKISLGLKDLLIKDDALFSTAIDKLNSKVITFSITFEG